MSHSEILEKINEDEDSGKENENESEEENEENEEEENEFDEENLLPTEENEELEPFQCQYCKKVCINAKYLKLHRNCTEEGKIARRRRQEASRVNCEICGDEMYQSSLHAHTLRKHIKDKVEKRKYECKFCSKIFLYKISLKQHLEVHLSALAAEGERKKEVCVICEAEFGAKHSLDIHLKNHNTGKLPKTECGVCKLTFWKGKSLVQHKRSAHADLYFWCDICEKLVNNVIKYRHKACKSKKKEWFPGSTLEGVKAEIERLKKRSAKSRKQQQDPSQPENQTQKDIQDFIRAFEKKLSMCAKPWQKVEGAGEEGEDMWVCLKCGSLFDHPIMAEDHTDMNYCTKK